MDVTHEDQVLRKIERLESELQSERASRAEEKLRASEREEKLCEELERLKKMFITYDEMFSVMMKPGSVTMSERNAKVFRKTQNKARTCNASSQPEKEAKKQEALEKENLKLSLLLKQQKSFSTQLQLEASQTQKTLLHLQEDMKKLLHDYEDVKGLLQSESETNDVLREEIRRLKDRARAERLVEKACQTTGSESSRHPEEEIKAWEHEKNVLLKTIENLNLTVAGFLKSLDKNEAEVAALREEVQELVRRNESRVEEEVKEEEVVKEEVTVETAPEPPQVSCGRTDEPPAIPIKKKRRRPSRWRRFINSFACGTNNIETEEEE